jgi:hypothetical protein
MVAAFPWARPRREPLLLALVAVAALLPVYAINSQDRSRLCLAQALVHGRLANDACLARTVDRARFGGHLYSDKAPGMSLLELPAAEAVRLPPVQRLGGFDRRIWVVRLLSSGLAFLAGAFLVGRVSEGLAPGFGGAALVAFALGTLVEPLAAANFGHVAAGTLAFAGFLLAWRGRHAAAGLAAGAAVLVEYPTAGVAALVALYLLPRGLRPFLAYAAGVAPAAALLAAYDAAAFGSPWHLSYRYVANRFAREQHGGLFGIGVPHLHGLEQVLVGDRGLLVISPIVVAAAIGLVLLARSDAAEALLCLAVTVFFVVLDCGYFLPYGGVSPGPRFLVPALPFLALGLGPAFRRWPLPAFALAAASALATIGTSLAWMANEHLRGTIWGELARVVVQGRSSRLVSELMTKNALGWTRLGSGAGLVVIAAAAAAAFATAVRSGGGRDRAPHARARRGRRQ